MKRLFLIQLLLGVLLMGCDKKTEETPCNSVPLEKSTLTDSTDYRIINSVLEYYYSNYTFLHIVQETASNDALLGISHMKDILNRENIVFDSLSLVKYSLKNEIGYFLSDSLMLNSVQLINPQELDCLMGFVDSGWEKYYQKYPKSFGFFSFSRPGLNEQGNRAVVEYGWYNNYSAGMGYIVILDKNSTNWAVSHRIATWAI